MITAQSFEAIEEAWRAAGVLVHGDDGQDAMNFDRAKLAPPSHSHYQRAQDLCVAICHRQGALTCSCNLYRETSECGHLLAAHLHLKTGVVAAPLPKVLTSKEAAKGRGRGRGRGRSRGWQDPESVSSEEGHEQGNEAIEDYPEPLVLPCKLRQVLNLRFTAGADTQRRFSQTLMLAKREQPRKLHALLMVDHLSAEDGATLSPGGQQQLTDFLFQHGALTLSGLIFSHHAKATSMPTIEEVMEMRRVRELCGSEVFFLGVTWRQGLEPSAGLQFYGDRSDREGVLATLQHDPMDFLVQHEIVEKEYRVDIFVQGAPLRQEKNIAHAQKTLVVSQSFEHQNPSLKLAKAADVHTFLQKLSVARKTKSLPVSTWLKDAPVAAGVRTIQDAQRHIREALEALAASQRLRITKKSGQRWDPTNWIVDLP
eukprot:Skav204499  [mRNA]  locus=scaffold1457:183298:184854:- [translate_table: standard]